MIYIALFQKSFQRMMTYRAATLAGIATNFFFGLLRAYVFIAVFEASGRADIGGYSLRDAITYTALTQALGAPLMILQFWVEVMRTIRSGEIVSDLTKPFHYFSFWLARDLGRVAFQLIFRGLPIFLFFPFFFELTLPGSAVQWALFLLSVFFAALISFCWRFVVNLSAFWFLDAVGIGRFAWLAMSFFSGFIVPVAFFPDWLKFAVALTPLPAMVNTPIEIYLGIVRGTELWTALGVQVAWVVGMMLLCEWVYRRGVQRLIIQGG
ncbi:MAG: ABC-2 family transporter protein [Candidatus Bipolaricaulota bacterium]|nr:ABC-2 family transporter protein [Candidatus Bipolaricaulota bacterium]MDW8329873.1 ABC-2 family transporter protein [Candidatus Bipolaricaulota bacterium]